MMQQYPSGDPQYASPQWPMKRRPTSVTTMAVLGFIVCGFFLLCSPLALIGLTVVKNNPAIDSLRSDPLTWAIVLAGPVVRIGLGIGLLIGSIGALNLKP